MFDEDTGVFSFPRLAARVGRRVWFWLLVGVNDMRVWTLTADVVQVIVNAAWRWSPAA